VAAVQSKSAQQVRVALVVAELGLTDQVQQLLELRIQVAAAVVAEHHKAQRAQVALVSLFFVIQILKQSRLVLV
jgi:polysaccharide deacetylase 2 family uncharacterized protein YibQ